MDFLGRYLASTVAFSFAGATAWAGSSVQFSLQRAEFAKFHRQITGKVDGNSGTVREPSRIYAKKTRPFENIVFRNVELPCGFVGFNADVRLDGGTFAPVELSEEERARIENYIANNRNLLN